MVSSAARPLLSAVRPLLSCALRKQFSAAETRGEGWSGLVPSNFVRARATGKDCWYCESVRVYRRERVYDHILPKGGRTVVPISALIRLSFPERLEPIGTIRWLHTPEHNLRL